MYKSDCLPSWHLASASSSTANHIPNVCSSAGAARLAHFRRFSCYCKPCYAAISGDTLDFSKCETRMKVGVWNATTSSYCNDPITFPVEPKPPTAAERRASAAEYSGTLKAGSWAAVDCTGGDDIFGFWLCKCIGKPYKATADVEAPEGMKDIKKDTPVIDVEWYTRFDERNPRHFKLEGIKDTVHTESLIVVSTALDIAIIPRRRNKVELAEESASAVCAELECRHPTEIPTWSYNF